MTDGVEVFLLWHPEDDRLTVVVDDLRDGSSFVVMVEEGESPLDVYYHPYAYAARASGRATILQEVR